MPNFNIESFKANFEGGARSYLFYFLPRFPGGGTDEKITYLVRSTSLPETTMEDITTNWQGYDFKMAGKYTFADLTITFNVDKDAYIIKKYEEWMKKIHDPVTNKHSLISEYMVPQQRLQLLDYEGKKLVDYVLHHSYPKMMGAVTLDYATAEVAQLEMTFAYQYHTIE